VASRAAIALVLALSAPAAAIELGTLFHTPEERARLDRLRRGEPLGTAQPAHAGAPPALTGYVQRSDGRTTVWIDGIPVNVAAPRAPRLEPKSVRAYSEDPDVKVERKPAR
jgi:hypothetical protein